MSSSENEHGSFTRNRKYSESKLKSGRGQSSSSEYVIPISVENQYRPRQNKSADRYEEKGQQFKVLKNNYLNVPDRNQERISLSPMRNSYEREPSPRGNDSKKPPLGPPKPARDFQRRREIERIQDSSGTEGESSQRSVVYLHATTGMFFDHYSSYIYLFFHISKSIRSPNMVRPLGTWHIIHIIVFYLLFIVSAYLVHVRSG